MVETYPKDVRIVFRNYPLRNHAMALPAAQAAMAAHLQGKFWPYHDRVFKDAARLNEQRLVEIAKELGLDLTRFNADRRGPEVQRLIQQDMLDAQAAGLRGTPAVYVNGLVLAERTPEGFRRRIEAELARLAR